MHLQQGFEHLQHLVTHFLACGISLEILCADFEAANVLCIEHLSNGILDCLCLFRTVERVAEEQGSRENRADWVSNTLTGDVGCLPKLSSAIIHIIFSLALTDPWIGS
jgi:hypothetical protein